tara:strand:+ start:214 stop:351 length:138 start_codon:yes stop_codon:yes gene_type:complete
MFSKVVNSCAIVKWLKLHGYTLALSITSIYIIAFVFVPFIMEVLK